MQKENIDENNADSFATQQDSHTEIELNTSNFSLHAQFFKIAFNF